ncbi:MAG: large-conductance mechanosensitive channel-like protein [Bacteroidetes bacterium]|nr:large-conductance mechanosensitive channel-like protein [Bacteroidota bacterium]
MLKEFIAFLKKYGVIGLAIAVVIGGKVNEFVSATVSDLLMPIIGIILPEGGWEKWVLELGPIKLAIGHWLGVAIDFGIVAFFIFLLAKTLLGEKEVAKR